MYITGVAESGTQTEGLRSVREIPGPRSLGCESGKSQRENIFILNFSNSRFKHTCNRWLFSHLPYVSYY